MTVVRFRHEQRHEVDHWGPSSQRSWLVAGLLSVQMAGINARIDDLSARLERLETDVRSLDARLRAVEVAFAKVDQRLETLERTLLPTPTPGD